MALSFLKRFCDSGARSSATPTLRNPIRVFAHLAHDKDVQRWRAARADGTLVGRNDETPYGYGRALHMDCDVAFPSPSRTGVFAQFFRLFLRAALGFDLAHAWWQRDALMKADVVWTHTESQFLAVAALLCFRRHGPKLIGQSVWLFDRWSSLPAPHRALFRRLIDRVDILTTHSPLNAATARALFPHKRVELVPFGIPSERSQAPRPSGDGPCRVVAVGNDRHRDWETLVAALRDKPGVTLEILSGSAPGHLARGTTNITIHPARTNVELEAAYARASLVVVPLVENLHASGITVIQEAVLAGVPVIASDVGGLRHYFGDDAITYVPARDPAALLRAVEAVSRDEARAHAMVLRAQRRITEGQLDTEAYIRRHVILSRDMLQ